MGLENTGEYLIPGQSSKISEEEHMERYLFAGKYVRDKSVLDLACGVGYGSKMLKEAGASRVLGCDISEQNIRYANQYYKIDGVDFSLQDARRPIQDKSFDLIVSFETIEHIDDYQQVLVNFYACLRERGRLIISSPNRKITNPYLQMNDRPSFAYHYREFEMNEFGDILTTFGFWQIRRFGQRQQYYFNHPFLEKHFKRIFKPSKNASPKVELLQDRKAPEYFILVAEK